MNYVPVVELFDEDSALHRAIKELHCRKDHQGDSIVCVVMQDTSRNFTEGFYIVQERQGLASYMFSLQNYTESKTMLLQAHQRKITYSY